MLTWKLSVGSYNLILLMVIFYKPFLKLWFWSFSPKLDAVMENMPFSWGCICFWEAARGYLEPSLVGESGDTTAGDVRMDLMKKVRGWSVLVSEGRRIILSRGKGEWEILVVGVRGCVWGRGRRSLWNRDRAHQGGGSLAPWPVLALILSDKGKH